MPMIGYWYGLPFGHRHGWRAAQVFPEGQHNDTWEKGGDEQLDRLKEGSLSGERYKKLWKITIFHGKTHYKWSIFNSYVTNYQRVTFWCFPFRGFNFGDIEAPKRNVTQLGFSAVGSP